MPADASAPRHGKSPQVSSKESRWIQQISSWDNLQADERIREGLPISMATRLQDLLGLTDEEAAHLIGRSRSTYNRYRDTGRDLGASEAERVVRYVRLFSLAAETFASAEGAKEWLFEANYALGGRVPFEMAETDPGARVVEDLLVGMQYGHPV